MVAETTGLQLKRQLGLDAIKYVVICRVLISTYKVYLVFYDTRRPNVPVTQRRATAAPMPSMLYRYPFRRRPTMTPVIPLETFNAPLELAMFFTVDLAGYLGNSKLLTRVIDSVQPAHPLIRAPLQEFLTLADLNNTDAASQLTKTFRRQRNQLLAPENQTAKLVDTFIDEKDRSVTFAFLTEVTPYPDDPDHEYGELDFDQNFQIDRNRSKTYELQIKVLDFLDWLDTNPDKTQITADDIKEILDVSNVQVSSTSPSFHWQSMNYNLSQVDASIHPTDIAPQFWNKPQYHGDDAFLDKHLYGLLRSIQFFRNPMAAQITKKLKDRGLL